MTDSAPIPTADLDTEFRFDNSYFKQLDGFFASWQATPVSKPEWLLLNRELATELGLDPDALFTPAGAAVFAGNALPEGADPLAQAYAGHQFGGFVPQLGDGRALLLGEIVDHKGVRRDIQLKGSGPTPFSRGGDGRAPLGPVLREYVVAEAMHNLGIATTRALAAVATGDPVFREQTLSGAVLTRVAQSHLRIGTFQFFAARGDDARVKQLADYAIARHDPELQSHDNRYLAFFEAVLDRQARLVAQWMNVGFVHGVMNTDNMTISGETIDYGPCAFLDAYDPRAFFSSIDRQGRYAYANQPVIAQWNLARLAETLLPLFVDRRDGDPREGGSQEAAIEQAQSSLEQFNQRFDRYWLTGMRKKLGLTADVDPSTGDAALANDLLALAAETGTDFTRLFRGLCSATSGDQSHLPGSLTESDAFAPWFARWLERLQQEPTPAAAIAETMKQANPVYIPRNHKVEEALQLANREGDLTLIERLIEVLADPYRERDGLEAYAEPAPADSPPYRTFCGT